MDVKQNVLLRCIAHSDCLREAASALVPRLMNNIFPWNDIRTLMKLALN